MMHFIIFYCTIFACTAYAISFNTFYALQRQTMYNWHMHHVDYKGAALYYEQPHKELKACTTYADIILLLEKQKNTILRKMQTHFNIPDDIWKKEVSESIKQKLQEKKAQYKIPSATPPKRDVQIPQFLIQKTEAALADYNIHPSNIHITYDKEHFAQNNTRACANDITNTISFNIKEQWDYVDHHAIIAHEIIHIRDLHIRQEKIINRCIWRQTGHLLWDTKGRGEEYVHPLYRELEKIHEFMADLLPLVEQKKQQPHMSHYFDIYFHKTSDDGIHPTKAAMWPWLMQIAYIHSQKKSA